MSAATGSLAIRLGVDDGCVTRVQIVSPRFDASPLFIGRSPAEALVMARGVFSLCPLAQSQALQAAVEAARGVSSSRPERTRRALRLLCERIGEMLRASLLDWPSDLKVEPPNLAALRETLAALRLLSDGAGDAFPRVKTAAEHLGLWDFLNGASFFARQWAEVQDDAGGWSLRPVGNEFLVPGDDRVVARAMTAKTFALAPQLPGRCVETGAFARQRNGTAGDLAGRLAARFKDMAATLDAIGGLLRGEEQPEGLLDSGSMGPGLGYAAVDSARGRLYHAVGLDGQGRIADCHIVAPTEWNFHPDGPFARRLIGARLGEHGMAKRRTARLAFVFDPCIGVGVEMEEAAHA